MNSSVPAIPHLRIRPYLRNLCFRYPLLDLEGAFSSRLDELRPTVDRKLGQYIVSNSGRHQQMTDSWTIPSLAGLWGSENDFYLLMRPLGHDHSSSCVGLSMHAGDEMGDGGYGVETQASGGFFCVLGLTKRVNSPCIRICFSSSNANSLSFNRYT